jgi:DNA-binding CsgD family transcriptional regulator
MDRNAGVRHYRPVMATFSLPTRAALGVLETAHEAEGSDWGAAVSAALVSAGGGAIAGAAVLCYRPDSGGLQALHTLSDRLGELVEVGQRSLSGAQMSTVYADHPSATTTAEVFGGSLPAPLARSLRANGMADFVGVACPLADGGSLSFGFGLLHNQGLSEMGREQLTRLALHLGTIYQVHQLLDGAQPEEGPRADAISWPMVQLLDTAIATPVHRESDHRHDGPDAWTAMLNEGWVVLRLAPGAGGRPRVALARVPRRWSDLRFALTPREQLVVEGVSKGASNKEVGYALGIPEASVGAALRQARRKLGVKSRLELVQLNHWLGASELVTEGGHPCFDRLTATEREVAHLALLGHSDKEIASRRGTTRSTVANQLHAIYRKLGIASRAELAALGTAAPAPERVA